LGANGCRILQGNKVVAVGKVKTGIYQLKGFQEDKISKFRNNAKKSNSQSRKTAS
jgi:glutamate dehydrogenase/leucine dehydrogenase